MLTETQRIRLEELCQDLESPEQAADLALLAAETGGYHAAISKIDEMRAMDEATRVDELVTELTQRGSTFSGGESRVRETAMDWRAQGFTRDSAAPWLDIGIWEPDVAATLRDWPLRPRMVRQFAREAGGLPEHEGRDVIYDVCNGDLSINVLTRE